MTAILQRSFDAPEGLRTLHECSCSFNRRSADSTLSPGSANALFILSTPDLWMIPLLTDALAVHPPQVAQASQRAPLSE